jgi:hypothetical protein
MGAVSALGWGQNPALGFNGGSGIRGCLNPCEVQISEKGVVYQGEVTIYDKA